ncbi:hypothetical protein ACOSP7_027184 [Xanthoceras sorbifolium]
MNINSSMACFAGVSHWLEDFLESVGGDTSPTNSSGEDQASERRSTSNLMVLMCLDLNRAYTSYRSLSSAITLYTPIQGIRAFDLKLSVGSRRVEQAYIYTSAQSVANV